MSLQLRLETDLARWDGLLKESEQSHIFCSSKLLESLQSKFLLYVVEEDGIPLLGCPFVFDPEGAPIMQVHLCTLYLGPWFTKNFNDLPIHSKATKGLSVLDFLLTELEKTYSQMYFSSHWLLKDLRSFSWFHYHQKELGHFKIELFYTGIIRLIDYSGFPDYLASVRKSRRQDYKKLEKNELRVECKDTFHDLDSFLALYRATFERQEIKLVDSTMKLVESITRGALKGGYGKLFYCYNSQNKAISAALFLRDAHTSYYLFGANDPEFRDLPGGSLVLFEEIKDAFQSNLKYFDMCGMNSPSRGAFKAGFNANPEMYFTLAWKKPI